MTLCKLLNCTKNGGGYTVLYNGANGTATTIIILQNHKLQCKLF